MQDLLTEIGERADDVENRGYNNDLPLRTKLLMTLWWLGNQETFQQVADRFGTTEVTLTNIMTSLCFRQKNF